MPLNKEATEIQEGKKINVTLTADVEGGEVIPYGTDMCVIASTAGLVGEVVACETEKMWELNAATADVVAVGDLLYFDATARALTTVALSNTRFGRATTAKAATVAGTVVAKLNAV